MGQRGGRQRVSLLIVVTAQTVVHISDSVLKRCPPSAARITSPQQKGAQLRVVELKHIVKGRLTFVVFRVHISSSVKQKRAQLCLFSADSNVQGCATRVVLRIRVSPAAEKKGAQLRVSSAYSKVKRCCAFVHSIYSVPPMAMFRALSIHVSPAVEKKLADLDDFSNYSNMKRRATIDALGRQVSSSVEQEGTQLCVLSNNGMVKQGVVVFVYCIHGQHATTSVEQEGTQLGVLLLNSHVKSFADARVVGPNIAGRIAAALLRVHDTGIKIQPAETHVSAIYRGEKRRVVDGTTLLAQRGNSTRSQRRHSIDAAPL